MNPYNNSEEEPGESSLIDKLWDIIDNLRTTVQDACHDIVTTQSRVVDTMDHLIRQRYINAVTLLRDTETQYRKDNKDLQKITLMKRKIEYTLKEYEFYTLIANSLEREQKLRTLSNKIHQIHIEKLPLLKKVLYSLWWIVGYNREQVLENNNRYELTEIISELDRIIKDEHFDGLSAGERQACHLKWKRYVGQARTIGVEFTGPFTS
jgi:hypothetical protein